MGFQYESYGISGSTRWSEKQLKTSQSHLREFLKVSFKKV